MTSTAVKVTLSDAEIALREGVTNFIVVAIGENLRQRTHIQCINTGRLKDCATLWEVSATVDYPPTGRKMHCRAAVPVLSPDSENGGTRIDDVFFKVSIDDYLEHFHFEAWCECNPYNGAKVIVRQVHMLEPKSEDDWLIGGGMDECVEYRGEFARMPQWAKDIAYKNFGGWIDTDGANLGPLVTD